MNFLRKIIHSDSLEHVISLPQELKHKKVELLIFPVEEEKNMNVLNPEEYFGVLNIKNPLEEAKLLRDEWERL